MKTEFEIAQAVLFAEKVKKQRRDCANKTHARYISKGYRKMQVYVPSSIVQQVSQVIKNMIQNHENKEISL